MTQRIVTLLLVLAAAPRPAEAVRSTERAPFGACRIDVQLIVRSAVPKVTLSTATKEIERIWRPYGVSFLWGGRAATQKDGQQPPLRIVLKDDTLPGTGTQALTERLASIEFLEPTLPRDVINVAVGSARYLLSRSRYIGRNVRELPPFTQDRLLGKVVGRSIAHELGHYLLASRQHTEKGLMRGTFVRQA